MHTLIPFLLPLSTPSTCNSKERRRIGPRASYILCNRVQLPPSLLLATPQVMEELCFADDMPQEGPRKGPDKNETGVGVGEGMNGGGAIESLGEGVGESEGMGKRRCDEDDRRKLTFELRGGSNSNGVSGGGGRRLFDGMYVWLRFTTDGGGLDTDDAGEEKAERLSPPSSSSSSSSSLLAAAAAGEERVATGGETGCTLASATTYNTFDVGPTSSWPVLFVPCTQEASEASVPGRSAVGRGEGDTDDLNTVDGTDASEARGESSEGGTKARAKEMAANTEVEVSTLASFSSSSSSAAPEYRLECPEAGLACHLTMSNLYPWNGGDYCRVCVGVTESDAAHREAWVQCASCGGAYHRACAAEEAGGEAAGVCSECDGDGAGAEASCGSVDTSLPPDLRLSSRRCRWRCLRCVGEG